MAVYELRKKITEQIAEAVRRGCPPWRKPWGQPGSQIGYPRNFHSDRRYSGVNPLLLMVAADTHGFTSKYWGTFGQWNQIGAVIKPRPVEVQQGRWATRIVFYKLLEKQKPGDPEVEKFAVLRSFLVFNADQVSPPDPDLLAQRTIAQLNVLAKRVLAKTFAAGDDRRTIAVAIREVVRQKLDGLRADTTKEPSFEPAERLILATGARIVVGDHASYTRPPADRITIPPRKSFVHLADFYETLFHELVHWSLGIKSRVDKKQALKAMASYAGEELIAEIGAAFIAAELGIPLAEKMLSDSESYIAGWLKHMGDDPKFIFEASTWASRCADYLLSFVDQDVRAHTGTEG